jgi:hypothetical protein
LTADDVTPDRYQLVCSEFYRQARDRDGRRPQGPVRILEKTPKNALRVPFFDTIWPDALFVYLYRDVRETLASMMEAWASGAFRTYPDLPGWTGYPWSLLLVPDWQRLVGRPLPEIVAHQWATTTQILVGDLQTVPKDRLRTLTYESLRQSPQSAIDKLVSSLGLEWDRRLGPELPLSKTTVSAPRPDKWRRLEAAIEAVYPIVSAADSLARGFVDAAHPIAESTAPRQ